MSRAPVTPEKSTKTNYSGKVAVPRILMHPPKDTVTSSSFHEPSPASTYGDTVAGDSTPVTPQDGIHTDRPGVINVILASAQFDDVSQIAGKSSGIAGSAKRYSHTETHIDVSHGGHPDPYSPSQAGGNGRYRQKNTSTNSPPIARRYENTVESPSWRRIGFVQQSNQGEDPFVSPESNFHPREDRVGLELSGDNAQAVLPPNACVFVANLCSTRTDDQLEQSVTLAFEAFGNVYVKIRRDGNGMPFAFCQYEHVVESERAITHGRGLIVDGRSVRTERAKVNLSSLPGSLYLSRISGGSISETEARQVLARCGPIEKLWYCTPTDKEMFQLADGIWAMFAYFQDARDAQSSFKDHPSYRLEHPPLPEDIQARSRRNFQNPLPKPSLSHGYVSPSMLSRRSADRCSIFVGNLPARVTQEQLVGFFGSCGRVRSIEIISKPSVNAIGVNVFAFVEFATEAEALEALKGEDRVLEGTRLRIERKEYFDMSPGRITSLESSGSPGFRVPTESAITAIWRRALAIGLSPVIVAQLFDVNPPLPIAGPPLPPPMYGPYPYYYQPPYGSYLPQNGMSEVDGSAQSDHHMHGLSQHTQQPMGQFQYPQVAPAWAAHPPYPTPAPYVYPHVNGATSPDTIVTVEVEALSIKETTTSTVDEHE
ncbi:hypothetical protein MMC06_006741 [Schaereria dolodes]|nr:hypothetical protein [Schaereria dolodes]